MSAACLQDGLFNCGGVQKLGESAASNKCCELCWCLVSGALHLISFIRPLAAVMLPAALPARLPSALLDFH